MDLYEMVKFRMWWDLALFENAFPEDGMAQAFMVKVWAEAVAELDKNDALMQEATRPPIASQRPPPVKTPIITAAAAILQPVNSNIPYKVTQFCLLLAI